MDRKPAIALRDVFLRINRLPFQYNIINHFPVESSSGSIRYKQKYHILYHLSSQGKLHGVCPQRGKNLKRIESHLWFRSFSNLNIVHNNICTKDSQINPYPLSNCSTINCF